MSENIKDKINSSEKQTIKEELSQEERQNELQNLLKNYENNINDLNLKDKQKESLNKDLKLFLLLSLKNELYLKTNGENYGILKEYEISNFDENNDDIITKIEFTNYLNKIQEAIKIIIELGGLKQFNQKMENIHQNVANSETIKWNLFGDKGGKTPMTDKFSSWYSGMPKEEIERLRNVKYGENEQDFYRGLFLEYPILENHREILGEITNKDIINRGENGIIIKPKGKNANPETVIKIPFGEYEIGLLDDFVEKFENLFDILKEGHLEKNIPNWIRIPFVRKIVNNGQIYFEMEIIDGKSFHTHYLLRTYDEFLKNHDITNFTEMEIRQLLIKKYGFDEFLIRMPNDDAMPYMQTYFPKEYEIFKKSYDYLQEKGITHTDLHTGNVMYDKKGNFYIIDFDSIEVNK